MQTLLQIWRLPDLRNRILWTLALLLVYRLGSFIPLPAVDVEALRKAMEGHSGGTWGGLINYMSMFTGGNLTQSTVLGLGVAPYISASIILQLLGTVSPELKKLRKEGPSGYQKLMEYTRYLTILLAIGQSLVWLGSMRGMGGSSGPIVHAGLANTWVYWVGGTAALTAGSIFVMWLGEQIDRIGIGNGVSLIITAGILATLPNAVQMVWDGTQSGKMPPMTVVFIVAVFLAVIFGAILLQEAQRRIPIIQAKHQKGQSVAGGQKVYLPLKVNHGGVMPIIFASTLLMFPTMLLGWLWNRANAGTNHDGFGWHALTLLHNEFANSRISSGFLYLMVFVGMIYFFAFFWVSVQFNPEETATNLRDSGSIVSGLRPGPRTAEYLEAVMERLTYCGGAFLCVIAILPNLVAHGIEGVDANSVLGAFIGGTSILIVVSVILETIKRIEAQMMMKNFEGYLAKQAEGRAVKADRSVLDAPEGA